jgi:hypothetical protein
LAEDCLPSQFLERPLRRKPTPSPPIQDSRESNTIQFILNISWEEFHLILSDRTKLSESTQQVRDWFIEESEAAAMVRLP